MPNKAFLEITNVCNLSCSFCHKTKRQSAFMSIGQFTVAAQRLRSFAEYLYFHLMGEPLLHPDLSGFFEIAHSLGFKIILTTNGTLLRRRAEELLSSASLHKVSISLHSYEGNAEQSMGDIDRYLDSCFDFCARASEHGIISVMRLWNVGGEDALNSHIISRMHDYFEPYGAEWKEIYSGFKIKDKVFLEWGERFDWPDVDGEYLGQNVFCYGLRDQVGVLVDGSVVPCCLDADGCITLGNIFEQSLEQILDSDRAKNLKSSLNSRCVSEPLCQRCGYAKTKRY